MNTADCYAVIFTSTLSRSVAGYAEEADAIEALARQQPGFLGFESVRDESLGISISYWRSEADIRAWRHNSRHQLAQKRGRQQWYQNYHIRICRVERDYQFQQESD